MNVEDVKILFDFTTDDEQKVDDIRRCLSMLYATRTGEQPLDREFGIDFSFLDKPLPVAKNLFAVEVVAKTQVYEPRVAVQAVTYEFEEQEGRMYPVIHLQKGDEW